MRKLFTFVIICFIFSSSYAQQELTNNSILELMDLGFGKEVILSKINTSTVAFDTSIPALKKLKEKGVPSEVLAAMIDTDNKTAEVGVFFKEDGKLIKILPSIFSGNRTSTLGSSLSLGIAPAKKKSYVNNPVSENHIRQNKPEFIFQFDAEDKNDLNQVNWWFKTASSPNEFVLTQLKQKKNRRELVVAKAREITGTSQTGIDDKDTIDFEIEDLGKGRYKITPKYALEPGEYCFFYQGNMLAKGYTNTSIFDFSIIN
tara:strand:- start:97 stop:873 length:777 start_codon:yes stop_codon:yes gene_type:complete